MDRRTRRSRHRRRRPDRAGAGRRAEEARHRLPPVRREADRLHDLLVRAADAVLQLQRAHRHRRRAAGDAGPEQGHARAVPRVPAHGRAAVRPRRPHVRAGRSASTARPASSSSRPTRAAASAPIASNKLVLATGGTDHPRRLEHPRRRPAARQPLLPRPARRTSARAADRRRQELRGRSGAAIAITPARASSISYRREKLPEKSIKYWLMPEINAPDRDRPDRRAFPDAAGRDHADARDAAAAGRRQRRSTSPPISCCC